MTRKIRAARLCRSWLFVEGANEVAIDAATHCGADVLIHELEDFTPPQLRPKARALAPDVYDRWRQAGRVVAVRVNPLDGEGMDDLAAVMRGRPDIVALPKVAEPADVARLAEAVARCERDYGIPEGATALLPNIEFARGLVQTMAIATVSPRVVGCLLASEDLAADLGAERGPDGIELTYARQRFLVECVAAGSVAVDCPYTWSDTAGVERDTRFARRLGYIAKSLVAADHASVVNGVLTPQAAELEAARETVAVFEAARARGDARAHRADGALVEIPAYFTAQRMIRRAADLAAAGDPS